ncbi:hypothetical protein JRQ81_010190 [Phrynocephalus forsythii]|uniref:Uncharacterized protein n=1 Tax=Phrynocephalus forsythii TaxID=171643 RepID=A0A9Q0X863_9SAUR|nr:hypothetical protein JRQ81_010190 [Phrynocephalus forsythii]
MLIVEDMMGPIPNADGNVTKKNKVQTKGVSNDLTLLKDRKDETRKKKERKLKVLQVPTASGYDGKHEKKKKQKRKDRKSGELQKHTEGESSLKRAMLKKEGKDDVHPLPQSCVI